MRANDFKFISEAEDLAWSSSCKYRLGAVITHGKRIVSTGINRYLGIEPQLTRWGLLYSLHAEADAIRRLPNEYLGKKLTLYVARRRYSLARPCDSCYKTILAAGINRVVFTDNGGFAEMTL